MKLADLEAHYMIDDREYIVVVPVEASGLSQDLTVTLTAGDLAIKPTDGEYDAEFWALQEEFVAIMT